MKRTTVKLPQNPLRPLVAPSKPRGGGHRLAAHARGDRRPLGGGPIREFRSAGRGNSGRSDISQRVDEYLECCRLPGEELIVDTSALFALVDEADSFHHRALALFRADAGPLLVPSLVVAETAYLVGEVLGPRVEALLWRPRHGDLTVVDVPLGEWVRIGSWSPGTPTCRWDVHASVVAAAERLGVTAIATTDRRHSSVVRPATHAFELPLLD